MYHPSRGGVRGGRDQFNWDDVKSDKHRENYLGHSIKAPVGRWQKGKDLHWYTRDRETDDAAAKEEIKRIKAEEDEAMMEMLGLAPKKVKPLRGNQLEGREVSELLKRGNDGDESAPSYAAGERIQGLGFAPAPGQIASKETQYVHVASRNDSPAHIPLEKVEQSSGRYGRRDVAKDSLATMGDQAGTGRGRQDGEDASRSEDEGASHKKRNEERRSAKKRRREEKLERKTGRVEFSSKKDREARPSSHRKERGDRKQKRRHDSEESEGSRGKAGRPSSRML